MVKLKDVLMQDGEVGGIVTSGVTPLLMQDTVWEDISGVATGYRFDSTRGAWDYDYADGGFNAVDGIDGTSNKDFLIINFQAKHDAKIGIGSVFMFHIHYLQDQDKNIKWKAQYQVIPIGNNVDTTWHDFDVNSLKVAYSGTGTAHQIQTFEAIDTNSLQLSGIVKVRLARIGTDAADTWSGKVNCMYFDCHYKREILGSKEEYVR